MAIDSIGGGLDATCLPQDELAVAERAVRQAAARANLAAFACDWYGVDPVGARGADLPVRLAAAEFATMCDVLGLETGPGRSPGTCRGCGTTLPMSSAFHQGTGYNTGHCWACVNGTPARPATEAKPATPSSYRGGVGRCAYCHRDYHLDGGGRFRTHPAWVLLRGIRRRVDRDCPGSGQRADEQPQPPEPHHTTAWGRTTVGEA